MRPLASLIRRWFVGTFARRIVTVVFVVLAFVLVAMALVVGFMVERAVASDAKKRFEQVTASALPGWLDETSRRMDELLRSRADKGSELLARVSAAADPVADGAPDPLEAAARTFDEHARMNVTLPGFWPLLEFEVVSAIAPDGRLVWNKVAPDEDRGRSWGEWRPIERALEGARSTLVVSPGDPGTPDFLPQGSAAAPAYVIQVVPLSMLRERLEGVLLVGSRLDARSLLAMSESAGVEVVLVVGDRALPPPALARSRNTLDALVAHARQSGEVRGQAWVGDAPYRWALAEVVSTSGDTQVTALTLRSIAPERALVRSVWIGLLGIFVLSLGAGLLLGRVASRKVSESVERLVEGTEALANRNYGHRVRVDSDDELSRLADSLNRFAEQLEKGEYVESSLKLFVPKGYFDYIVAHRDELKLGGQRRTVTLLFADLGGFTGFSEEREPEAVVKSLNEYFDVCTRVVETHEGVVDKFVGDAVMALWNAPVEIPEHPGKALVAALELVMAGDYISTGWPTRGPRVRNRVGVHTGAAMVGLVGGADRRSYTAMGDVVNVAARLESANKIYGTRVLTSAETRAAAGDAVETRFVDRLRLSGRDAPVDLYEVLCAKGMTRPARAPEVAYRAAWELYAAGRFAEAGEAFAALAGEFPDDGAAATLAARCIRFARTPPAEFDGVFRMAFK